MKSNGMIFKNQSNESKLIRKRSQNLAAQAHDNNAL